MTDATPPAISVDAALDSPALFGPWFAGASWASWRAILRAAYALPMTEADIATFRDLADRDPPPERVKELWIIAGRRAGKDSIASAIATYTGALIDHRPRLRPGERATILCLAVDRAQAKIVLNYTRGYFENIPAFKKLMSRETAEGFDLRARPEITDSPIPGRIEVGYATAHDRFARDQSPFFCGGPASQ